MEKITTDIIVILYGDDSDLKRCKQSVEDTCTDYIFHVRDNNKKNLGFTKACNDLIREGTAPYIWLLNQDAIALPGAQEALIRRLESGKKVGMAGSCQLDPKDHDRIAHGGTSRCFPSGIHKGGSLAMGHCRFPEKQTWLNGASVMFKRSMYNDIGPMDESMFLLYSDADYAYEARSKGYEVWYEPDSKVLHTLGQASKNSAECQQKDMLAFMQKWGIKALPNRQFEYSQKFQKLDMFP